MPPNGSGVELIGHGYASKQRKGLIQVGLKKANERFELRDEKKARKTNHGMDRLFRLGLAGAVSPCHLAVREEVV